MVFGQVGEPLPLVSVACAEQKSIVSSTAVLKDAGQAMSKEGQKAKLELLLYQKSTALRLAAVEVSGAKANCLYVTTIFLCLSTVCVGGYK